MLATTLGGCIFSPHTDKCKNCGTQPPIYPKLINPFTVLDALKLAYAARDSNEVKLIYDKGYQGVSFNPTTLDQLTFTKTDEIRHIQALYRTTSITSVDLSFPPSLVRTTASSDLPGWATITVQGMSVQINDSPTTYNLRPNETFEFKFIPTAPDSTSETDTTWKIVRWTELQ